MLDGTAARSARDRQCGDGADGNLPGRQRAPAIRIYPYRPDVKVLGSYTLPFDIQLSGTYQFTRGVQTGGAGTAILATWTAPAAQVDAGARPCRCRPAAPSGAVISLIQPGTVLRQQQPESARSAGVEALPVRAVPLPHRLRRLQHPQQQLAVLGDQHVLDAADQPVAAADQRAAVAVLQDRRAVRLLDARRIADSRIARDTVDIRDIRGLASRGSSDDVRTAPFVLSVTLSALCISW